jgi:hypothetical protein
MMIIFQTFKWHTYSGQRDFVLCPVVKEKSGGCLLDAKFLEFLGHFGGIWGHWDKIVEIRSVLKNSGQLPFFIIPITEK